MIKKVINLFNFFDKKIKNKILLTQSLLIISAIFEILTIFSIGPLMQVLSDPNIIYNKSQLVSKIYFYFNFSSFDTFLLFIIIVIFIFLSVSTIILTYSLFFISMFSAKLGQILRNNLFKYYISQEWLYHSKSNTSEYLQKISSETNRVAQSIILQVLLSNAKIITGVLLIISLTIYNPLTSIICFLFFGTIYALMFKLVKSRLLNHGYNQSNTLKSMFKIVSESFIGIKEAIIYGNQRKYFDNFAKIGDNFSNSTGKITFLGNAPRYILEFLAIAVVITFIFFLVLVNESDFNETLPIIAIYIFAGYKLLPIFQGIYFSLTQIKANIPALEKIEIELYESKKYKLEKLKAQDQIFSYKTFDNITFKNVSFNYGDQSKKAVKNISFEIKKNTLNFIVGSSGSGKSTLLDLLLGLLITETGEIYIENIKLTKDNSKSWQQNLGYVGQNIFLFDETIKNNICFNNENEKVNEKKLEKAIKDSRVENFLNDLPNGLETIVGERGAKISGGQKQRVALARAFYQDKNILILDEATASLDGIIEKMVIDQLKLFSKNKTIIMVTHNVKLCNEADNILLLDNGFIVDHGDYNEIKKNTLFKKLLNEL
jgi:HlyD family secretion protein